MLLKKNNANWLEKFKIYQEQEKQLQSQMDWGKQVERTQYISE